MRKSDMLKSDTFLKFSRNSVYKNPEKMPKSDTFLKFSRNSVYMDIYRSYVVTVKFE